MFCFFFQNDGNYNRNNPYDDRNVNNARNPYDNRNSNDGRNYYDDRNSNNGRAPNDDRNAYNPRNPYDDRDVNNARNPYDDRNSYDDRNRYNDNRPNDNPRLNDDYDDRNRYTNRDYEQYRLELERKNRIEDANLRRILDDVNKLAASECSINVGAQWNFETNVNEATQQESVCKSIPTKFISCSRKNYE